MDRFLSSKWTSSKPGSATALERAPEPAAPQWAGLIEDGLREITPARIALPLTGVSLTTRDTLAFALDHAQARDAVHASLSIPTLLSELRNRGLAALTVASQATDREMYLRRPDLGGRLDAKARALLAQAAYGDRDLNLTDTESPGSSLARLSLVIGDGLSALAADRHAIAVIDALLPLLDGAWTLTRIAVAEEARVRLGDEIGSTLGADATVMLLGERPGLSAADSLGAYITWAPGPGRTNAERNCISNIHGKGLTTSLAAERIAFYLAQAKRLRTTGTILKDPDIEDRAGELL